MAAFNFGSFAEVKPQQNHGSYLKAYSINENVTIKSAEIKEGTGSTGNAWKALVITFGNDDGIYPDSTFFLDINDPQSIERNTIDTASGGQRQLPSRWEQTYYKLAAIGYAFAAEYIDKFNQAVGKCKTFEQFIGLYKQMIDKVIDKNPTSMKLVGRNNGGTVYATLPSCVGIAQARDERRAKENNCEVGGWYTWMVSPFGEKLYFSSYEEGKKRELETATPTVMESEKPAEEEDDIDFDSLL